MGSINQILIGNQADPYYWSSDITKLYNQLHLVESAYPYSLFLYNLEMDIFKPPDVYVMVVAWYGVTPTGSQAGHAIERAVSDQGINFPLAVDCLINRRYVDVLAPGAQSKKERSGQEQDCTKLLESIGLKFKYIVKSGEVPCEKVSSDGLSVKILGYKWFPEKDTMSPGFSELNLNKKIRRAKKPNLFRIVTREDARELLAPVQLTKRIVVSKILELHDPVGLFEPIKLQYKLEMRSLSGLGWDEEIIDSEQQKWKDLIAGFVDLEKISIPKCSIPSDSESLSKIKLICLSDAAEHAGRAAVYGGRRLIDGTWSCSLITAKSKLLNGTIPRNELSAIMLMTELHETIRRMINWTTETETIPLFHIDGLTNIADLLTKHHAIGPEDVFTDSE